MALSSRRKKKTVVSAETRSTTGRFGPKASQRPSVQHAGKRKANELAGSAPLPASTWAVPGKQAAASSRQLRPPVGGVTYAAVKAGPVAPIQLSGSLTPTATGSDLSEPAASSETTHRCMSSDMSGSLCDKPDGTTPQVQVTNACLPAGERPNKTPIFITGVNDARAVLAWFRASCPSGLTAQLKGENLMVVPSTADGFRAAVSALQSLDGKEAVSFHIFTFPEDRCVRLLVKNLGRGYA